MKNIITAPTKAEKRFMGAYKASNVSLKQVRSGNTPKLRLIKK